MVFKLRDGFWTLADGPLDPLDRYKNPQKKFENLFFGDFFHIRPLAGYNRQLKPINRCWKPFRIQDFDWSFTLS